MTTPGLPVSRVVNVGVVLSPKAAQAQNFNSCLVLGTSSEIDVVTRMRQFASASDVAAFFGGDSEESQAAKVWFAQQPQPTSILIGRWAQTASHGELIGGSVSVANQLMTFWNPIVTGAMEIKIDGIPYSLNGLNFAAAANMNGVAAVIQTALQVLVAGALVTWNAIDELFEFTSPTTGVTSSVSFGSPPRATGNVLFNANAANNDTITINGTVITFKMAAPVGNQVLIGGTVAATIQNLTTFLNASTDANIVAGKYIASPTRLYVEAAVTGVAGNTFTLAASVAVPSGATLVGGSGVDIATPAALLQTTPATAYLVPGIAPESALEAVEILDDIYSNTWYGLVIPSASDEDHLAVGAYIEADTVLHYYGVTSMDVGCLDPNSTTDIIYLLQQLGLNRTMAQYSSFSNYAVVSALARILTTNWNGTQTAITLKFKLEPTIVAENLTLSQADALENKNGNVFVNYTNDVAILEQGTSASGQFVDAIIGTDWFANFIQNNTFNALFTNPTKIPQTDAGNHIIATVLESSCNQALQNGLLGPGQWNAPGFGQLNQGDQLPKGFYIYTPPVSSQSQADRDARKSVPFQIAAKYAGAIHSVDVVLNVNQ